MTNYGKIENKNPANDDALEQTEFRSTRTTENGRTHIRVLVLNLKIESFHIVFYIYIYTHHTPFHYISLLLFILLLYYLNAKQYFNILTTVYRYC